MPAGRRHLVGLALIGLFAPLLAIGAGPAPPASTTVASGPASKTGKASKRVRNGRYAGTTLEDGKPVRREFVRFRVKRGKLVVKFRSRVWLHCYRYPNNYYQLPIVFRMPRARIKKRRVNRAWRQRVRVDGDTELLKGRVQLRFLRSRRVRGRLSIDLANCATRLGDPPHWVRVRVKRR